MQGGIPSFPTSRDDRGVEVPGAVRWLAERGNGRVLLEYPPAYYLPAAERMLSSTFHWLPMIEGYSAYTTKSDQYFGSIAMGLPRTDKLQALVDRVDLGWILVHTDELPPRRAAAWRRPLPGLELVRAFGPDLLFRVVLPPQNDLREKLFDPDATVGGTPKRPLGASCPGSIRVKQAPPDPWIPQTPGMFRIEIRNEGERPWPGESLSPQHLIRLRTCWVGRCEEEGSHELRHDVPAGGAIEVQTLLAAPTLQGEQVLRFRLDQVGGSSLEDCGVAALEWPVDVRHPAAAAATPRAAP
jgi:hypothetical protein